MNDINIRTESNRYHYGKLRIIYFIFIIFIISLGLASRKYSDFLPPFLADNAGDALWAMMVYLGFRSVLIRNQQSFSIILSILFSYSIEFSQLYQADWINHIRNTTLGALILGKGFLVADLIRYTVGILFGAVLDRLPLMFSQHK